MRLGLGHALFTLVPLCLGLSAALASGSCGSPYEQDGPVPSCVDGGGLCAPQGNCVPGGGTVPAGATDCYSDLGPVECCMPPAPLAGPDAGAGATGTTCADHGGVCLLPEDCNDGQGYFDADDGTCSGGASLACCFPHGRCGDATFGCCASFGGSFPPVCGSDGQLSCAAGYELPFTRGECAP